jgi:hypothetical protein
MTVAGAAVVFGCTIALIVSLALNKPVDKFAANALLKKQLGDIGNLIDVFPTASTGKDLFIRPETHAGELDPVKNPDRYASKSIVLRLKGGPKGTDPFNPVKLREIFSGLAFRPNFEHILLYNNDRDFVAYIPAWYARYAFVTGDAESRIARAITDTYSGSFHQANLHEIRGATDVDVISEKAKLSDAMERFAGGITLLVVMKHNNSREAIGFLRSERVIEAIKNSGALEPLNRSFSAPPMADAPKSGDLRA